MATEMRWNKNECINLFLYIYYFLLLGPIIIFVKALWIDITEDNNGKNNINSLLHVKFKSLFP